MSENSNQLSIDDTLHGEQTPSLTSQCPVCKTDYTVAEVNQCSVCNWDLSPCPEAFVERYNSQLAWAKELWLSLQTHEKQLCESRSQLVEVKREQAIFEGKILYRLDQLEQKQSSPKNLGQEQLSQGISETAELKIQLSEFESQLNETSQERQLLWDEVSQLSKQVAKLETEQQEKAADNNEVEKQTIQIKSQLDAVESKQYHLESKVVTISSQLSNNTNEQNTQVSSIAKHLDEIQKEQQKFVGELSQLSSQIVKLEEAQKKIADKPSFWSETSTDYSRLRYFLQAGEWKKANYETSLIVGILAGVSNLATIKSWEFFDNIDNISCEDLKIIDKLWLKYSYGRFGFSVQHRLYKTLNRNSFELAKELGWVSRDSHSTFKFSSKLHFGLHANIGQLPFLEWFLVYDFYDCDCDFFSILANKMNDIADLSN